MDRTFENEDFGSRWRTLLLYATAGVIALSRLAAVSRSLWDWDEALFCLAIGEYDVTQHHPHPPGFPVYVAMAKVISLALPAFRSYQLINGLAACALFPLLFLLARELRFNFTTSYCGALLYAFLPNVWFFGGTAFSDVSGIALILAACLLLLRGREHPDEYVAGGLILGLAVGIRPQALLFAAVPSLIATWVQWQRSRTRVFAAILGGLLVVAICYGGAALASYSIAGYFDTAAAVKDYVRKVDSFLSPGRPSLASLAPLFLADPMRSGKLGWLITGLAAVGTIAALLRRDRRVSLLLGMFLPFALFAWLMLDLNSVTRYSVAYLPMYALLAAHAPFALTPHRFHRITTVVAVSLLLILAGRAAWWTLPALQEVRRHESPTARAGTWLRDHATGPVYADGGLGAFVSLYLPGREIVTIRTERDLPVSDIHPDALLVVEGSTDADIHFIRERGRIFDIARRRYFEVSVTDVEGVPHFREGWYDPEGEGEQAWRWMSARSRTLLPARNEPATLSLDLEPVGAAGAGAVIEVALNGALLDRFVCPSRCVRRWDVIPRANQPNELTIVTNRVVNPARSGISHDRRDLGLRLMDVSWSSKRAR